MLCYHSLGIKANLIDKIGVSNHINNSSVSLLKEYFETKKIIIPLEHYLE